MSSTDPMEIIQKLVLETLEKNSLISDTRVLFPEGAEFNQQQVLGVLMRLESHQVSHFTNTPFLIRIIDG